MQYPKTLIHANGQLAKLCVDNEYVFTKTGANVSYQDLLDFGFTEPKDTMHPGKYWYPESDYTNPYSESEKKYYFIEGNRINRAVNKFSPNWETGNAFKTQQEAEKELEKRKAIVNINRYISDTFGVFEPDWSDGDQEKSILTYGYDNNNFDVFLYYINKQYSPIGYFSCKEHAEEIIDKFNKELRLIWDV